MHFRTRSPQGYLKMHDRLVRLCTSIPILDEIFYWAINKYAKNKHDPSFSYRGEIIESGVYDPIDIAIAIAAPRNIEIESWGDFHFAKDLAESLKNLRKSTKIVLRGDSKKYQDGAVFLNLRGLLPIKPPKNTFNILWVISHPDQLSKREIRKYDLVFAASEFWASKMSEKTGKPIGVLLQAMNPLKFYPDLAEDKVQRSGIVFVGNTKNRSRKIVQDVISLGYEVKVYGNGWSDILNNAHVISDQVKNEHLPKIYREAKIVLNDQWKDMSKLGFISNRVIEAISSGAICLSHEIENINSSAIPNFVAYRNLDELKVHLEDIFGGKHQMRSASKFQKEFNFDARAKALVKNFPV